MAPTLFDRALASLAPGLALRRAEARVKLRRYEASTGGRGGYEGASRGRRTEKWITASTDANAAIGGALPSLRARSRDLVRNNAWASNGVAAIEAWTVGTGIAGQPMGQGMVPKRLHELWEAWAGTTACDADGDLDFAGIQALTMRCKVEAGSVLIRRRTRLASDGFAIPLQLQVMEPDHLDLERITGQGTNQVIQGVEYDAIGRRVAYWLYPDHPGTDRPQRSHVSVRVPASEIAHVFRSDRVGQVQGVPWLTPAIIRLRNLDEFEDAELLRMTIASSWAAFVTKSQDPDTADGDALEPLEDIRPGAVEYLNAGETVEFPSLPAVSGMDAYTAMQLRAISAALHAPYELLTGDLSKVNFSSGRMGFNAFERRVAMWQRNLRRQLLDPVAAWFVEAAIATGIPASARAVPWVWTPPARMILDPSTEGQADYEAVRNGAKTLSEILRARGKDPRAHLEELAEDLELVDELGLKLDLDPRNVAKAGSGPSPTAEKAPAKGKSDVDEEDAESEEESAA